MDYESLYFKIISRGMNRDLRDSFERHHIIPKCEGGSNDPSNLVKLTYREHLLCHWILTKIYPNSAKLRYALFRLNNYHLKHPNSKTYERVRRSSNLAASIRMIDHNPMRGKPSPMKGKSHSKESIEKISKRTKELFKNQDYRKRHRDGVSAGVSGEKHPFFGKHHSEESLRKAAKTKNLREFSVFKNDLFIGTWWSQSQCCRDLGLKSVGNLNCCLKSGTSYNGFYFKYI